MLDHKVIKKFLIDEFEDFNPIPTDIDTDKLAEDFANYVMDDFYDWLKDNFHSFFDESFDWKVLREKYKKNSEL